jgi:hypothetical protein
MNDELQAIWKEAVLAYCSNIPEYIWGGLRKTTSSAVITVVPRKI